MKKSNTKATTKIVKKPARNTETNEIKRLNRIFRALLNVNGRAFWEKNETIELVKKETQESKLSDKLKELTVSLDDNNMSNNDKDKVVISILKKQIAITIKIIKQTI